MSLTLNGHSTDFQRFFSDGLMVITNYFDIKLGSKWMFFTRPVMDQ
jgi:hypothetical protein